MLPLPVWEEADTDSIALATSEGRADNDSFAPAPIVL